MRVRRKLLARDSLLTEQMVGKDYKELMVAQGGW